MLGNAARLLRRSCPTRPLVLLLPAQAPLHTSPLRPAKPKAGGGGGGAAKGKKGATMKKIVLDVEEDAHKLVSQVCPAANQENV